ncbi:MAG: alpha/beta hydrolase [Mycoplasmataceae bacterium]|jgi:pimeloyl-ACP methyl ester carboxylesterase|nr:alpha/beta hydrolase [Mycoplasmataceae bacterium]
MKFTDKIKSTDGTIIAYHKMGTGPSIVIVHGGMELGSSHLDLANTLSQKYTVYLYDRRDRGASVAIASSRYCMQEEISDLMAMIQLSQAKYIFAVSAGALITLQFLLTNFSVEKVMLYEPPLSINGSINFKYMRRFDKEIASQKILDAFITTMRGSKMAPSIMKMIPRFILRKGMKKMGEKDNHDIDALGKLIPTFKHDVQLAVETQDTLDSYKVIKTQTLLIGGGKSPKYLKTALHHLQETLPHASTVVLKKCDHIGSSNKQAGGNPDLVAQAIFMFLQPA